MNPELFQGTDAAQTLPKDWKTTTATQPGQDGSDVVPEGQLSEEDKSIDIAPFEMLEGYYQQLEEVLLKIGYLYPHTAKRRMEKFRFLFNRSKLSVNEVAMLRGILRQIEWATPSDTTDTEE